MEIPAARVLERIIAGCRDVTELEKLVEVDGGNVGERDVKSFVLNAVFEFRSIGLIDWSPAEIL